MKAYSMDLRERVVADCDSGNGTREQIAARFSVSIRWIRDLLKRRRETGSIAPRPHGGGHPPAFDAQAAQRLRQAVKEDNDATLEELRQTVEASCSISAVHRAIVRMEITRKKVATRRRAGLPRTEGPTSGLA